MYNCFCFCFINDEIVCSCNQDNNLKVVGECRECKLRQNNVFDGKVPVATTLWLHRYCYIRWWISVIPHYRLKSCRVTVNAILCEFQVSRLRIMLFTLTWPCTHQSIHHDVTTPVRPGKPRLFVSCPNSTALVDPNQGSL